MNFYIRFTCFSLLFGCMKLIEQNVTKSKVLLIATKTRGILIFVQLSDSNSECFKKSAYCRYKIHGIQFACF